VLVAGSTLFSVDFLNQIRGFVPGVVLTEEGSTIVALMVELEIQMELLIGVYVMVGPVKSAAIKSPSSAPISGALPAPT
jgi:hypothetical protein